MAKLLLVRDDAHFCATIQSTVKSTTSGELDYALNSTFAAEMIRTGRFDIVLISMALPDRSEFALADLAAEENMAVLLLADTARNRPPARRPVYPMLQPPFTADALIDASRRTLASRKQTVRGQDTPLDRIVPDLESLRQEMAESHRMFDAIVSRLGYGRS